MIRTKEDVEQHSVGYYGDPLPAVNVKVYKSLDSVPLPLDLGGYSDDGGKTFQAVVTHEGFTHEWVEEHLSESDIQGAWELAIEDGWEQIKYVAEEVFGHVEVWAEGRSGGWAVIKGLDSIENWDAIMLGKWRRFDKAAKAVAADTPWRMLWSIYANIYEPALDALNALDDVRDWRDGVQLWKEAQEL